MHVDTAVRAIPEPMRATLLGRSQRNTLRSLLLTSETLRVLDAFERSAILAMPLKGVALAASVYGSVALRQAGDIDILVRENDLDRALTVLTELAYEGRSPGRSADMEQLARKHTHHLVAINRQQRTTVELHYALSPPRGGSSPTLDVLEPFLTDTVFMGARVRALRTEELFVYLCQHGAKHAWSRLEWLATVATILRSGEVRDWDRVERFAALCGGIRRIHAAIALAAGLFDEDGYPHQPRHDRFVDAANRRAVRSLYRDTGTSLPSAWDFFMYQVLTDGDSRERLTRLWMTFAAPNDDDLAETGTLANAPAGMQYLLRPLRMLGRQAQRTWQTTARRR